ncbi:MAG TPA: hypothetical protein VH575_11420 [Gemmataceae bacterium]|jgi:hypothetical protein
MNVLRRFGLPVVVVAPVVAAVAALWNYLLLFAYNDGVRILIYLSMCLLALAGAAAAQHFVPDFRRQHEADEKTVAGCETKPK